MTSDAPRRRWLRWIVLAVAVVVVLAVGIPFAYIHFIEGSAPAKFSLSASGTGSGGATVPLEGTWTVATGSQVGYRVGEVLVGQNNTAVGRTSDVTGRIVIKDTTVTSGSFTANLKTVHSDQRQRDGQFQGKIMDTATYPTATFTLTKSIELGPPPGTGVTITPTATGKLTMHGTTRPVTIQLSAEHVGANLEVLGSLPVVFADWKIPQPAFPGVATVQNHGIMEFLLRFTHGSAAPSTTAPPTTLAQGGRNPANSAYLACLAQHGVTLPSAGGQGGGGTGGPPGSGGPPGNGGQQSPPVQAALQACASLRPAGGPGGPGGGPDITVSPTTVAPLHLGS